MSDIEKLKALLEEARYALDPLVDCVPLLTDAIDAALAEPVRDWQPHEDPARTAYVVQVERERDEARDVAERNARDCAHLRQSAITLERERDEAVAAFHEATRLRSGIQQARIKAENERDEAWAKLAQLEALSVKREVVLDKLRWVSQEARAAIMLGYTGPNHETLRKALAQLTVTEGEP